MVDPCPRSHQLTDYEEGERHDVNGNIVRFERANTPPPSTVISTSTSTSTTSSTTSSLSSSSFPRADSVTPEREQQQQPINTNGDLAKNIPSIPTESLPTPSSYPPSTATSTSNDTPQRMATTTQEPSTELRPGANIVKGIADKAVSKAVRKHKKTTAVLPDYYEQFPDVQPSLFLTVPVGTSDLALTPDMLNSRMSEATDMSFSGKAVSFMRNAATAVNAILSFSKPPCLSHKSTKDSTLQRGTYGIRKVAIIGIHGWYPRKALRTLIGEPTGTSQKFCQEMDLALKDYLHHHGKHLDPEDVTLIPLDGEGKVLDRVEMLYGSLVQNEIWKDALQEADLVLVATHSQGTPTSVLLMARLIDEGLVRVKEENVQAHQDPKKKRMQRIGMLTMAGISHGPFPFLKGNFVVRVFEREAASELFEFMDSESRISQKYREGLRTVLSSGVRMTCVASLEDQVVPLYSAVMTSVHHPSIVRAVYVDDGASYKNDFLINLIAFSLRLRNAGVDDHGILVHLSEVIAGSLYGEGHSTIYDERDVYLLSIRSLLEPPASLTPEMTRREPIMKPFRAKQRLNPFYLPWGMRGVADEIVARGDQILLKELERLKRLYIEWNPVSKAMKEIKFRLEPVRSKL
ncbi:hypothetical protein BGX28_010298 [Mortierella sp. GBA30]|nr:hypothetical protein BGX28_010298 [Mortierella sp. GBA30]